MLKRLVILTSMTGALVLCTFFAHPALRLRPASEVLREPANVFAKVKAIEPLGQAQIRFEVVKLYSDERVAELSGTSLGASEASPEVGSRGDLAKRQFDVRVGAEADVKAGGTYIIGITRFVRSRFPQSKWRLDPEGYRLVSLPVVGEAIFVPSPDLELLLTDPANSAGSTPRKTLDPILRLLQAGPIVDRRVAALELLFQPQLGNELKAKEIVELRSIIEDGFGDPVTRDYLLQATSLFPGVKKPDWVADSARNVLRRTPLKVELGSALASFQHTTLRILKERGSPEDLDLAARMLRSASPGVTMSAIQTMEALDPERALIEARAALKIDGLPEQSKRYLSSFVKRAEYKSTKDTED